jgi:hypothetical protein
MNPSPPPEPFHPLAAEPLAPDHRLEPIDNEPHSLVELVNRVLDRGVVVNGDVTISVAGVDLVYLGLNALLTSVSTARRTLRSTGPAPRPGDAASLPAPAALEGTAAAAATLQGEAARVAESRGGGAAPPPHGLVQQASEVLGAQLTEVADSLPSPLDINPDAVQRDLARLVLTLVELLRRVVEHQAVQRMEDEDLTEAQVERMGVALQRLEEKLAEIKAVFGLADDELNIDLGPLGKLL